MFERNPIDTFNATAIAVEVRLTGGQTLVGRAALERGQSVHHLLRGGDDFLYVESADGDGDFVPRSVIAGLKVIRPVVPQPLRQPAPAAAPVDAARILGVGEDAAWDDVKAAYHEQLKSYHPDKFAHVALPKEVARYMDGKAKQITQAFQLMKAARNAG